jgi:hypothetical protein
LGGTTRGGQYGLDWAALRLMTPPNGAGGFGRYLPSIVVVAAGDPGAGALSGGPGGRRGFLFVAAQQRRDLAGGDGMAEQPPEQEGAESE